jgi:hypothetical protein
VIDLSDCSWDAELPTSAVAAVGARLAGARQEDEYADIDRVLRESLPSAGFTPELSNAYSDFYELTGQAFGREQQRAAEDAESRRPRRGQPLPTSEEKLSAALARVSAGTYTLQGQYAVGLANQPDPWAATTGGTPCGFIDAAGRCGERFHAASGNALATPDIALAVRPAMEQIAVRPHLDADGRAWQDRQFGAPMTLTALSALIVAWLSLRWAIQRPGPDR